MSGRGVRAHIRASRASRLGGVAVAAACTAAAADTLEWALVQAYQNNPSLNAQRARCARPTRMCRRRCPATARSSASPPTAATTTPARSRTASISRCCPNTVTYTNPARIRSARRRRDRDADAVQRLPDRQSGAPGGEPGHGRARNLARHRAAGAARCRHLLHEFAARRGDPRSQPPQRRGSHRAAQADARPLQRRRGDAHRRGAGRIAARGRPIRVARRAVELRDVAGQLSARHRRRSGPARARHSGRPLSPPTLGARSARASSRARRCSPPCMASISPSSP